MGGGGAGKARRDYADTGWLGVNHKLLYFVSEETGHS